MIIRERDLWYIIPDHILFLVLNNLRPAEISDRSCKSRFHRP